MKQTIDLRSDTVTVPSAEMLEAMMRAVVGDDVFDEDPTVKRLQEKAATLFGKEAGLFCPSGTMTNQISINVHTRPGEEVVCDQSAHVYLFEGGGIAFNSGCSVRLLQGDRGRFTANQLTEAINAENVHFSRTRLVTIENTANKGGGCIWALNEIKGIRNVCDAHGLKLHLDGARIFNALAVTEEEPQLYGSLFDSISICLSKGLGAPAGSLILGSAKFIHEAKRRRKVMGGGMRQAGFLAAAGIFALDHNVSRLEEDHARAHKLAEAAAALPYVVEVYPQQTNIVVMRLDENIPVETYLENLEKTGVKAAGFGKQLVRFVTHLDISDEMLDETITTLQGIKI
ncbi:MAG: GntG family PLP-dependent aldolase [Bacteroidia bacterium]